VWGTSDAGGSSIEDYANKQWSGLMGSFYRGRCAPRAARPQLGGASAAAVHSLGAGRFLACCMPWLPSWHAQPGSTSCDTAG